VSKKKSENNAVPKCGCCGKKHPPTNIQFSKPLVFMPGFALMSVYCASCGAILGTNLVPSIESEENMIEVVHNA